MKTFITSLFFSSILLISCKDGNNEENNNELSNTEEVEVEKPTFLVDLDLIIKKDDTLQLFYAEYGEEVFNGAKNVSTFVKGDEMSQKVMFKLPADVSPTKLRIDFGNNVEQDIIEIKNFKITYLDKVIEAKDTMFFQYFIPNEQIKWDRKNATLEIIEKNKEKYDPQFGSREVLEAELEKMLN